MKPKEHRVSLQTGQGEIRYSYFLSRRRRTIGMTVRPDLSITVRAPVGTAPDRIDSFVASRAGWISRVLARFQASARAAASGTETAVRFLGRSYPVTAASGTERSVRLAAETVVVTTPEPAVPAEIRQMIGAWYSEQAVEILADRMRECHRRMEGERIPLPAVRVRPMTSRWGSYSYRTGVVSLNSRLIEYPIECVDYVIIHELCHALVRHHGPSFWAIVGRYVPDYPLIRRSLRY